MRFTACTKIVLFCLSLTSGSSIVAAQVSPSDSGAAHDSSTPATPAPDVIVFTNGDQLTGQLVSAAGGSVVFKSDMAGQVTIPFSRIKRLRSGAEFAVLPKGAPLGRSVHGRIEEPVGTVEAADNKLEVMPPGRAPISVPTSDVAYIVNRAEFEREMTNRASFLSGWNGAVTGGATLVRSTTTETSLTAGIALVRAIPDVAWIAPRNRTTFDLTESYGKDTSPGAIPQTTPPSPSVTTLSSIFHADAERDEYYKPTAYGLGDIAFDHNYAQGLDLQQIYGVGVGLTLVHDARQELDVKADVHYERQAFITAPVNGAVVTTDPDKNLIGSSLFESYHRTLPGKVLFLETGTYIPAFNETYAYSGTLTATLTLPVWKRLGVSVSSTDDFLNDPAPGYHKNSLQFVTGVTYTLR